MLLLFNRQLSGEALSIRATTRNMLLRVHDWGVFSNHFENAEEEDLPTVGNSLEGVHDIIHGLAGGAGHMGNVPVAGEFNFHRFRDKGD